MKPILSEDHHMTTSMLQQRNLNVLTCAVFSCKMCTKQIKNSLNSYSTLKSPKSKVVQTKSRFFKFAVFPLLILIALSCYAPTVDARTTAYLDYPTATNSTLTTSFHGNESSPIGIRPELPRRRVLKVTKRRDRRTRKSPKRYQRNRSMKPRKLQRRKSKGKRRNRKGCKKKNKKCKKRKNNNKKKNKKKNDFWGGTGIRRMYSKSGNSFHLAVLQNGTVKGEPSHLRSDYC